MGSIVTLSLRPPSADQQMALLGPRVAHASVQPQRWLGTQSARLVPARRLAAMGLARLV